MSAYQFEKTMLQELIEGLRQVYNLLIKPDTKDSKASLIKSLYAIHTLSRQEAKYTSNLNFALFKLPDYIFAKYFLCCFNLNDICRLTLVCTGFDKRIRSNIFLLYYTKAQEKTNIRIDLNTFTAPLKKMFEPKMPGKIETIEEKKLELEAQLKVQKRTEAYLISKLEDNDKLIVTIQNDIKVMKELHEKEVKDKNAAIGRIRELESEFAIIKEGLEEREQVLSQHVNDLETKVIFLIKNS